MVLATPEYDWYSLVVTGHSLGAGTAAILVFLLLSPSILASECAAMPTVLLGG